MAATRLMPLHTGEDGVLSSIIGDPDYRTRITDTTKVFRKYIMQRGGWSSDKTLKAIYRGGNREIYSKI